MQADRRGKAAIGPACGIDLCRQRIDPKPARLSDLAEGLPEFSLERDRGAVPLQGQRMFCGALEGLGGYLGGHLVGIWNLRAAAEAALMPGIKQGRRMQNPTP